MDDLLGVTLEFKDGEEVSEDVTRLYMAAPEMYRLLDEIAGMDSRGEVNIPDQTMKRIIEVLSLEERPDIIEGVF